MREVEEILRNGVRMHNNTGDNIQDEVSKLRERCHDMMESDKIHKKYKTYTLIAIVSAVILMNPWIWWKLL